MTTTLDIVTRALRRIRVTGIASDASSEDAAIALQSLNDMMQRWAAQGVNVFYSDLVLTDTFGFIVPPDTAPSELITLLVNTGTWDASTNTPTLASASGTAGVFYKVSVAGSTTLDDVSSWSVGDYLVYSGYEWLKCPSARRFERAVVDNLALDLTQDYGKDPGEVLVRSARDGWRMIQAAYIKSPMATFDAATVETFATHGLGDELINTSNENDGDVYVIED